MEGISTRSLIEGTDLAFREEAFAETPPAGWQALQSDDREIWCVRTASWKLILNTRRSDAGGRYELYDLKHDPRELRNLYGEAGADQSVVRKLSAALEGFIQRARREEG